jgi:hypothetical protein
MSNNKQSSVEWLKSTVKSMIEQGGDADLHAVLWHIEQAKAMHRQEIINAVDGFPLENRNLNGTEYYEQTYGGNNDNP